MEIKLAKYAGFCFGVNKAVNTAFGVDCKGPVYTLGNLIHNNHILDELEQKGIKKIESLETLGEDDCVIIRAHGVGKQVYDELVARKITVFDATCPYVKRIHQIVNEKNEEGFKTIIVGDPEHPEVIGINGWCEGKALIISDFFEAENLEYSDEKAIVVAQTTYKRSKYDEIFELLNKKFAFALKFDTICSATVQRQTEAEELSREVDTMIVIGGKNSSNTQKLYEICKENCSDTYLVEKADELPIFDKNTKKVGITAGASTPDTVIKEVIFHMEDMMNGHEGDLDFSKALEMTFTELRANEVIKGKIIGYNNNDVFVDLGYKADGLIPMEEFLDDPDFDPERDLVPGKEIEALVIKINDGEGNVALSKKKVDSIRGFEIAEEAFKNGTPIDAVIKEIVKGGAVADFKGVRIFIPASQLSDRFVKDITPYKGKKVTLLLTEMANRRRVVGSCRAFIEAEKAKKAEIFWSEVEIGKEYTGIVKNIAKFGVFVDIGGVDGLIHISELSWKRIDDPSSVMKVDDEVTVRILDFDREKKKISLGYRKAEDNPWYNINIKYNAGDVVTGTVLRMVPFGVFVELEEGVEGLVHISQISSVRIGRPDEVLSAGQQVEMKILDVNADLKKISLSIKEISPIDPVREGEPAPNEENGENIPTSHSEIMSNTIGDIFNEKNE